MSRAIAPLKSLIENWLHNRTFAIWAASILTVLIRLGAGFAFKTYRFDTANDHWALGYEWGRVAKWLVESSMYTLNGSSAGAIVEPLYPFTIAVFFYVFGLFTTSAAVSLIVFQSLLCGLNTWVLFILTERIYGPLEARVCSFLFALYPASIFFAVARIGPTSLTALLLCLILLLTLILFEHPRTSWAILAGSLTGLLFLTGAHPFSLIGIVPLWLLWVDKNRRLRMFLVSLIFVASAIFITMPWAVRNSLMLGRPTMSKTGLGLMLWKGNNPVATGYTQVRSPDGELGPEDDIHLQMAVSWIADNPKDFAALTMKRILYFWTAIPRSSSGLELLNGLFFMVLTVLGVFGAFSPEERAEGIWLLLLFVAIFPIVFYITVISHYRYRFYIEPLILVLASRGIIRLWQRVSPLVVSFPSPWFCRSR